MSREVKKTAADDSDLRARGVAAECNTARIGRMTMRELARKAGVSVRLLVGLENPTRLAITLRKAQNRSRQRTELTRMLAQVAMALEIDPKKWLREAIVGIGSPEIEDAIERAKVRLAPESIKTVPELQALTNVARDGTVSRERIVLKCGEIPYGPFARKGAAPSTGTKQELRRWESQSFLGALTELIVGSISPDAEVEFHDTSDFSNALRGREEQIVLGYLAQLHREVGLGHWHFAVVPGFRVRMSFLATRECAGALTGGWRALVQGGDRLEDVRLSSIADSVADNVIRGMWKHWAGRTIRFHQLYNPQQIAEAVGLHLSHGGRAVFVTDEVTADEVRDRLALELVDLAESRGECVPAFPVGIAAQVAGGNPLTAVFTRVLNEELFEAHMVQVAELYSNYLARALAGRRACWRSLQSLAFGGAETPVTLPSYLRIRIKDRLWDLRGGFERELLASLEQRLSAEFVGADNIAQAARLFIEPGPDNESRV